MELLFKMAKSGHIIFLLFFLNANLFAQGNSTANASATIITSVGAEKLSDINFGEFSAGDYNSIITLGENGSQQLKGGIKIFSDRISSLASFTIIGSSSQYNITMQSNPFILRNNEGSMGIYANVFTLPSKNLQPDNSNLLIGATISVDAFQPKGKYSSPFAVTINFD